MDISIFEFCLVYLLLTIRRSLRCRSIRHQGNNDLALTAAAFDLHAGGHQSSQEITALTAKRFGGYLLRSFFFHRSSQLNHDFDSAFRFFY